MLEGDDIATADWLCSDLDPEAAARRPAGAPHSIATVTWHTWVWIQAWNRWIGGQDGPFDGNTLDTGWPDVPASDWPTVRDRLNAALRESAELAATADLNRPNASGWTAGQNLLQITIHTAYHFGQMALIRQELGLWPPP